MEFLKRRDFIKDAFLGAGAIWQPPFFFDRDTLQKLLGFQHDAVLPAQARFPDLAQYEEAQHPLRAGRFDEALRVLTPAMKERPGVVPYTIASIYLRMERHAEGIPYALQACRDTPDDIRYRWMLRVLTLHAGQPESTIPKEFRLKMPLASPSSFQFRDVTDASHAGRLALARGASWGDFDTDDREGILVGAEHAPVCLFHNRGDGTFEDVPTKMSP